RAAGPANGTQVEVKVAPVVSGAIPAHPDPAWHSLGSQAGSVPGQQSGTPGRQIFGPFNWMPPAAQEYAVLAAATCPSDPSNIDPISGNPCVTIPSPVNILVACDNNLGLIRHAVA